MARIVGTHKGMDRITCKNSEGEQMTIDKSRTVQIMDDLQCNKTHE